MSDDEIVQAMLKQIGALTVENAALKETCAHLSERIEHWQTNAGINATSLAQVDAEFARLTRVNAELVAGYAKCIRKLACAGWDYSSSVHEIDLRRLTQQGTNE